MEENRQAPDAMKDPATGGLGELLLQLVTNIPASDGETSPTPVAAAERVIRDAAWKAAGTSGMLALPPGPLGLATILPDLMAIWRIQQQMVADIARVFGKEAVLTREVMAYCLFKHGAALLVRDLVIRAGERYLIRPVALRALAGILQKVGVATTQKALGRIASRWVPVLGALAVAAYARWDTQQVGRTAVEMFSGPLELPPGEREPDSPDPEPAPDVGPDLLS
jgi:uncharacterized protein (DUF697 family)